MSAEFVGFCLFFKSFVPMKSVCLKLSWKVLCASLFLLVCIQSKNMYSCPFPLHFLSILQKSLNKVDLKSCMFYNLFYLKRYLFLFKAVFSLEVDEFIFLIVFKRTETLLCQYLISLLKFYIIAFFHVFPVCLIRIGL